MELNSIVFPVPPRNPKANYSQDNIIWIPIYVENPRPKDLRMMDAQRNTKGKNLNFNLCNEAKKNPGSIGSKNLFGDN